jgi:cytochrome b involved in lipid metabolism
MASPDGCRECRARWEEKGLPKPTQAVFTGCDVAALATPACCWFWAYSSVYDASAFLQHHPGGPDALLRHAGQDCSTDFDFHGPDAHKLWREYRVGRFRACEGHPGRGWGWLTSLLWEMGWMKT